MKIGLISDIHGKWAALQAVLNEMRKGDVSYDLFINAGDNVGYGPEPEKCLAYLRSRENMISVRGNYDKNIARFPNEQDEAKRKWHKSRPEKYEAIARDSKSISEKSRQWLLDLPREISFDLCQQRIIVTHYAPGSKEGLGKWTATSHLKTLACGIDAAIVVCGHTHSAFVRSAGDVLWINPGAVGDRYSHHASYAILNLEQGAPPVAELYEVKI